MPQPTIEDAKKLTGPGRATIILSFDNDDGFQIVSYGKDRKACKWAGWISDQIFNGIQSGIINTEGTG